MLQFVPSAPVSHCPPSQPRAEKPKAQNPCLSGEWCLNVLQKHPLQMSSGWFGVESSPHRNRSHSTAEDAPLPCLGSFLLPTASPCSVMVSSLGRMSAGPGRRQSLPQHTAPMGCRDPALKDSPGHPWLHTRIHSPAAGRRQLWCPVLLTMQRGSPAEEHILPLTPASSVR